MFQLALQAHSQRFTNRLADCYKAYTSGKMTTAEYRKKVNQHFINARIERMKLERKYGINR